MSAPDGPQPPHYRGFTIILRHTTLSRTPQEKGSARRRDLYVTTHNTHNRQTFMLPGGIRIHNSSKQEVADPRLRLRGSRLLGNLVQDYTEDKGKIFHLRIGKGSNLDDVTSCRQERPTITKATAAATTKTTRKTKNKTTTKTKQQNKNNKEQKQKTKTKTNNNDNKSNSKNKQKQKSNNNRNKKQQKQNKTKQQHNLVIPFPLR